MGWKGGHLHEFTMPNSRGLLVHIGSSEEIPHVDYKLLDQSKAKLGDYFSLANKKADYTYDFGDDWEHEIVLEKVLDVADGVKYPVCIAGKRACPPENCGGVWGYYNLVEILSDPQHEEYKSMLEWCGEFDAEAFDITEFSLSFHE
jgi:hypothetical protein